MASLASALAKRGHKVQFLTGSLHGVWVRELGLEFVALDTQEAGTLRMDRPDAHQAFSLFWHRVGQAAGATLDLLAEAVRQAEASGEQRPELVASTWAVGARIARDHWGLRLTTVHMSPSCILSAHAPPVFRDMALSPALPLSLKRLAWWLVEKIWLDPICLRHLRPVLQRCGMWPVRRLISRWIHSPDRVIAMFPAWFCAPQQDWPAHLSFAGFPLADQAEVMTASASLEAFLSGGSAPVVFITGSAMRQAEQFFANAVEVCRSLGCRGLILTRHAAQLPALPDFVHHEAYAPLSRVLPRCLALVSHAGIGTASLAVQAGLPQLFLPYAHDQFDNARLFAKLGVGRVLPSNASATDMVMAMHALLESADVAQACQQAQERLARDGSALMDAVLAQLASPCAAVA